MSKHADPTESSFHAIYIDYKRKARKKGRRFLLTKSQFRALTKSACYYCGKPPSRAYRRSDSGRAAYIYTGVDRVDSDKGYSVENCVPCCTTCNYAKGELDLTEFVKHLGSVISHLIQSGKLEWSMVIPNKA